MKSWAAVDPSSIAGVVEYKVSVATSSWRLGMLRMGLGARIWFLRVAVCAAPLVPYCVVALKVASNVLSLIPGKNLLNWERSFNCAAESLVDCGGCWMPVNLLALLLLGVSSQELSSELV